MINVNNDYEVAGSKNLAEVDTGAAFIGTVQDVDGDDYTGVFIRTANSVVFLDDAGVEFGDCEWDGEAPCVGFKYADLDVTVTNVYED
jgi:hypothetical protein